MRGAPTSTSTLRSRAAHYAAPPARKELPASWVAHQSKIRRAEPKLGTCCPTASIAGTALSGSIPSARSTASKPATCGAANDVPDHTAHGESPAKTSPSVSVPVTNVLTAPDPTVETSTHGPRLE